MEIHTNIYNIEVDYTLVKECYIINDSEVAKFTVHSYPLKDQSIYENDDTFIFEMNASDGDCEWNNYKLPITKSYEEKTIKEYIF